MYLLWLLAGFQRRFFGFLVEVDMKKIMDILFEKLMQVIGIILVLAFMGGLWWLDKVRFVF